MSRVEKRGYGILRIGEHIKTGAEARIFRGSFLGIEVIIKERYPRRYRESGLDLRLRQHRTRTEARILREARNCGVPTPYLLDLDLKECMMVIEYLPYPSLKQVLNGKGEGERLIHEAGRLVGILHSHGIVHGDLTTSNILVNHSKLFFIDFGLSEKTEELEAMGVDLHVFTEAFESTHSSLLPMLEDFIDGYLKGNPKQGKEVLQRAEEISRRGRYH